MSLGITDKGTYLESEKSIRFKNGARATRRGNHFRDDFDRRTIDGTNEYTLTKDNGTNFAPVAATVGGMARGATGTTQNDKVEMTRGELIWQPSRKGLVYEARVKMSLIDNVIMCVALVDAKSFGAQVVPFEINGGAITSIPVDGVGFVFDSRQTTPKWTAIGVKNNTDAGGTVATSGAAPVADTYDRLRVEVDENGNALFYQGDGDSPFVYVANAVTASAKLCPYIGGKVLNTTSKNIDADYHEAAQGE